MTLSQAQEAQRRLQRAVQELNDVLREVQTRGLQVEHTYDPDETANRYHFVVYRSFISPFYLEHG